MRKFRLHAAACALVLACASSASAAANFVYHEQTANFVATPTCPSAGTDSAAGRYVENTDRSGSAGYQVYSLEKYTLSFKVEYQFFTDSVAVYYTTDGSTPSGTKGAGNGTTQVISFITTGTGSTTVGEISYFATYSDQTQGCQIVDVVRASIPAQPAGTTVKYIVGAWHHGGGAEYFANSGQCSGCFSCTDSTTGCAFTSSYDVIAPPAVPLIISEFRWQGTNGASDEFIEVYNNSGSSVTINTFDGSAGYAVATSSGTTLFTIPNGTPIPARGHYLGCNNTPSTGYSLATYPAGNGTTATCDATWTGTDALPNNAGIALFRTANASNFTSDFRLDAAGTTTEANTLYKEGDGVYPLTTLTSNYSYVRYEKFGLPQDTGVNANDFIFVDTNGNCSIVPTTGTCVDLDGTFRGRHLGAPGPENSTSPIVRNTAAPATLVAPCVSSAVAPNRVRDTGDPAGAFGTISFRRKITNNTGANITRLRFRLVDVSVFPDGNFTGSPNADMRAISSSLSVEPNPCGGGTVTIQGLTLEEAASPNDQPNGGGFNSSLSAGIITFATPLPPTDNPATVGIVENEINVNFLFGVQSKGNARFWFNIEVLP